MVIGKIRVLAVDDSAMVRKMLSMELSKDPQIEVIDTAVDPFMARDKILEHKPDVILLDIEMPRMDGLTFLRKLMKHYPSRVIIVSSVAEEGGEVALAALEYGAMDVIAKPAVAYSVADMMENLTQKIKEIAKIPMWRIEQIVKERQKAKENEGSGDRPQTSKAMLKTTNKIIAIGASTGGTEAITKVLQKMPANAPPIVIVQHMPQFFTKNFADRIDKTCAVKVKEAEDSEILSVGKALIAPGNYHMEIKRSGAVYYTKLTQEERVFHQRPAVEVLFNSVAKFAGKNAVGVILTGMGRDGAQGLLNMRNAGAYTIAQDEKSCIVFGMPKEAIDLGAVNRVVSIERVTDEILRHL